MQPALRPPLRNVDGKGLLTAAERAEIRHLPVKANRLQQAFHKPGRLPQRHADADLHRQASLDGGTAACGLSPTLACRHRRKALFKWLSGTKYPNGCSQKAR